MTKAELRKIFLAKRKEMTAEERHVMSVRIAENFFDSFDLSAVGILHCFIPIEKFNEVDTTLIFRRLWSEHAHVQTVVPRVTPNTGTLQSIAFSPHTELIKTSWGIHEPAADELVRERDIDVVLTPGLVFDKAMHRVGYGKGYYDRFLSKCRPDCLKIGLSFFEPAEGIDDVHDGDVRLDSCVTPASVFTK